MATPAADTDHDQEDSADSLTTQEVAELTMDQLNHLDHPVPVTKDGQPVAWLTPLSPSQRRRAELIAAGRIRPRKREGPPSRGPLPAITDGPTLSELLIEMRGQERT